MSIKASDKTYGATMHLVLVVAYRRVQAVDAITIVHLTICNNNGNNALRIKKYSARLTRLKLK
jgi:hypothetical protein